jgi:TetR/AcrR family transcriptional repressor of nem operon
MADSTTREMIIRTGADLIALKGFGATGINAVLSATKVPKGSFYHYFKSKDDFGLAVIESHSRDYDIKLDAILEDATCTPVERLRNYFQSGIADMTACEYARGCLIGNLGQELAAQNELFRARLDEVFAGWEKRFAACIDKAQERGELDRSIAPRELASFLLSGWEGAILRAKVVKSVEPMRRFERVFFSQFGP